MFELDIERLHRDTEKFDRGELVGRGTGRTTVLIYKLLGAMEVANPGSTFVFVAYSYQYRHYLIRRVYEEMYRNQINVRVKHETEFITDDGIHVMFVVPDDVVYDKLAGIRISDFFIDDIDVFYKTVQEPEYVIEKLKAYLERYRGE